ncbi:AMP-binding protein [Streptomyces sp. NPDC001530]|uniref:AMP-binding protein n=1 Tax=Streptomyces sp. NPDC001530 TaxID=3364582 RepID=UPI0036A38B7B
MTNLATFLVESAAVRGDRIAVRHDDSTLTYAQLDEASARVATLLRVRGLQPGDRIALTMPNVPLFPVLYYGVLRAGGVVVPMNPLLKAREVAFTLRDCGARIALAFPPFADEVAKACAETGTVCLVTEPGTFEEMLRACEPMPGIADRSGDDPALILYTSGTTGSRRAPNCRIAT